MELRKSNILSPHILSEVRKLHFHTRKLVDQGIAGQYKSAFRGRGIEFEEVREYSPGDEIRSIDWKVTARAGKPYVKSYREERELTVMIAVDVSRSTSTGSREQLRESLMAKVGAVLTLIALNNNDKVGLVTFSDRLETYHPARKARSAVWRILHEVLTPVAGNPKTNLSDLFQFLNKVLKRSAIVFVISDFFDRGYERSLAVLAKRHDVTAIVIRDPLDASLPDASLVEINDPETGEPLLLDTGSGRLRRLYEQMALDRDNNLRSLLRRNRVGILELQTDTPFLMPLQKYFSSKWSRRSRVRHQGL